MHNYEKKGEYHVKVTGTLKGWAEHSPSFQCSSNYSNSYNYVIGLEKIESFGPVELGMGAFAYAKDLKKLSSVDIPDASELTSMSNMFCKAKVNVYGWHFINNWDMSNIKYMSYMFYDNDSFNQEIGGWNTENVENMNYMFRGAKLFNQDIGNWNTSNVENMSYMFKNASAFNQNIGQWNVANVNNMSNMFEGASVFNQDISGWNVSIVRNMSSMFKNAKAFNQNLSAWKLSSLISRGSMFSGSGLSRDNYCAMKNAEGEWWKGSYSTYGVPKSYEPCP